MSRKSWASNMLLLCTCAALLACSAGEQTADEAGSGSSYAQTPIVVCPQITDFSASPLAMGLGGDIDVTSGAENRDPARPLTFYWIASSGTFRDATAVRTRYTCTERGEHLLQLVVSDGECADYRQLPIRCINNWAADSALPDP